MDDFTFTTETHFARIRVMESARGVYRGYVYLRRTNEGPNDDPHTRPIPIGSSTISRSRTPRSSRNVCFASSSLEPMTLRGVDSRWVAAAITAGATYVGAALSD